MTQQPGSMAGGAPPLPFFGGQFSANPFPMFAQMRAMGAVVPIPFPFDGSQRVWMITRMQEAQSGSESGSLSGGGIAAL